MLTDASRYTFVYTATRIVPSSSLETHSGLTSAAVSSSRGLHWFS